MKKIYSHALEINEENNQTAIESFLSNSSYFQSHKNG